MLTPLNKKAEGQHSTQKKEIAVLQQRSSHPGRGMQFENEAKDGSENTDVGSSYSAPRSRS